MMLTQEFITLFDVYNEVNPFFTENNLIDGDYDDAIEFCINNDKQEIADWLTEQKSTEYYVRNNGSILTMGAYQVFNPLTGRHTRYETEAEAKAALVEIAKQVLEQHCPRIVQEISNENGDTTWISTELHKELTIS